LFRELDPGVFGVTVCKMKNDLEQEAIQKALDLLAEHFEVAQIFVQVHRGGDDTDGFEVGFGNFFARQMQIHRWHMEQIYGKKEAEAEEDDE
jgi:hypothetical protein